MIDWDKIAKAAVSETFVASETASVFPQDSYYSIPRISNSSLDYVPALLKGKMPSAKIPAEAAEFGRALHEMVLEPWRFRLDKYEDVNQLLLARLQQSCRENEALQELLSKAVREVDVFFDCEGLPCKARIDILSIALRGIADIKTTSASDLRGFTDTIHKYNYDRQMAFYADAVGAETVTLIAISKTTFQVFFVPLSQETLQAGREKYKKKLQLIKEHDLCEKIFALNS